ncbi:uncharacterized protein N7482_003192 [Penicillium canariense]|uniref:Uncharacterized protein n=1 Tax=Penicillium canariense TaxID=189055 RepID=A0A9W9I687_9EURO|nr:uncharacterized protein N7482_003192 [Penicillium canariense]KAJ5167598.1 hypothetical protein N7482_003192 [Penicillium canariense]
MPEIAVAASVLSTLFSGATSVASIVMSHQFIIAGETIFINLISALMHGDGVGSSGDIRTFLQDGSWVNVPDMDMAKTSQTMMSMIQSSMINYLCACNGIGSTGPKDQDNLIWWCDDNNQAWYLYYWQRRPTDQDTQYDNSDNGWIARPWGSDRMGKPPYLKTTGGSGPFWENINPSDAVISAKAYRVAGNDYDTATWNKRIEEIFSTGANPWSEGTSMEGLWTIPVCDISATVSSDYDYAFKQYILQPYGYGYKPKWCGPICGNDANQTIAFYQKANFGNGFSAPFLDSCEYAGKTWDWQTGDTSN